MIQMNGLGQTTSAPLTFHPNLVAGAAAIGETANLKAAGNALQRNLGRIQTVIGNASYNRVGSSKRATHEQKFRALIARVQGWVQGMITWGQDQRFLGPNGAADTRTAISQLKSIADQTGSLASQMESDLRSATRSRQTARAPVLDPNAGQGDEMPDPVPAGFSTTTKLGLAVVAILGGAYAYKKYKERRGLSGLFLGQVVMARTQMVRGQVSKSTYPYKYPYQWALKKNGELRAGCIEDRVRKGGYGAVVHCKRRIPGRRPMR